MLLRLFFFLTFIQTGVAPLAQAMDTLVQPLEILRNQEVPSGTFALTSYDFVITAGPAFQGAPPPGSVSFAFGELEIKDIAVWNNETVDQIEKGGQDEAVLKTCAERLQAALAADPLFFPLLYNLGRIYLLLRLPEKALIYLERARPLVPEFGGTYYNMALAHKRLNEESAAIKNYRLAFHKNPFDPRPLVELGNYYLEKESRFQARYYFDQVLKGWPENSGAKIGLARLYIDRRDLYRAREILYSIPTENIDGSNRKDYNRLLHYYLALIATDLRDYGEAVRQYDKLLDHPEDPFFLEMPYLAIKRRREIAYRLAEIEGSSLIE